MTQNNTKPTIQTPEIPLLRRKYKTYHKDRYDRLDKIAGKRDERRNLTKVTQHIGCTGIAAAFCTDIHMIKSSYKVTHGNTSAEVSHDQTDNICCHDQFSFLSLTKNFNGVPENPNASRILFSRYLVYEKCISFLLLTKITNVGGFTLTCVI